RASTQAANRTRLILVSPASREPARDLPQRPAGRMPDFPAPRTARRSTFVFLAPMRVPTHSHRDCISDTHQHSGGNRLMKLVRFGAPGREKPGIIDDKGRIRDLSKVVPDIA